MFVHSTLLLRGKTLNIKDSDKLIWFMILWSNDIENSIEKRKENPYTI